MKNLKNKNCHTLAVNVNPKILAIGMILYFSPSFGSHALMGPDKGILPISPKNTNFSFMVCKVC